MLDVVTGGKIQRALAKAKQDRLEKGKQSDVANEIQRAGSFRGKQRSASEPAAYSQSLVCEELSPDKDQCKHNRVLIDDLRVGKNVAARKAYQMLRTRFLQRMRTNRWSTIGVTSPSAGDGKSLTALNLALSIARQKNNEVILADFDLLNPSLCRYLGVEPENQISDFLKGDVECAEVLFSIGIEKLWLTGGKTVVEDSSDLLASKRVSEFFQYFLQTMPNPIILVDLPPLLTTDDALVMGLELDAMLLVVCEGRTRRDFIAEAIGHLDEYNLAGLILNDTNVIGKDKYTYPG